MRGARLSSLALTLALAAGCAAVEGGARPTGPVIHDLRLEGTKALDASDIEKKILTGEGGLLDPPQHFDPNTWQADLRRIERYYQAEGYYDARVVDSRVVENRSLFGTERVDLQVKVAEGQPTRLTTLELLGLETLAPPEREALLQDLPLVAGDVLREERWAALKDALRERLREGGHAEAQVEGEVQVETTTRVARARVEVTPGPLYRFGRVFLAPDADAQVEPRRIVEQVERAAKPGAPYSESALVEAQTRVFQMGVFGVVKVARGEPDRARGTVPIVVDVREAPFHSARYGGGIGIDPTRQEARVLGEYTDRNFFGDLRRYTLRAKAGYAALPSVLNVLSGIKPNRSGPVAQISNELEQPRFLLPGLALQASLQLQRGLEPAYDYVGATPRVGISWKPRTDVTVFPSFNLDVYRLSNPPTLQDRSPAVTYGCPLTCVLAYLEETVELDRRDDRNEPREGFYLALALQQGLRPQTEASEAFTYLRIQPEARGYYSFGAHKALTFAAKLKVGTLVSPTRRSEAGGYTPIVARFFSGGGSSMRGSGTRRLSPMLAEAFRDDGLIAPAGRRAGVTLPIGGDGLLEAAGEVRYNLVGDLVVALFFDAGFVTVRNFVPLSPAYYLEHLQYAAGLGLRYRTPLGPIRVDVARRLPFGPPLPVLPATNLVSYPSQGECFGIGSTPGRFAGYPEGLCAFHLSIGEAF